MPSWPLVATYPQSNGLQKLCSNGSLGTRSNAMAEQRADNTEPKKKDLRVWLRHRRLSGNSKTCVSI